jgi:DNA-directed RNA polymerase sigma subunit (sigma70/sigma32)
MQLGFGYWSLPSIERRMADLETRKPRRWHKRLKLLKRYRDHLLKASDTSKPVKGWKGRKIREERYRRIRVMLNTGSLASVGKELGISRQRVHQIVTQWK